MQLNGSVWWHFDGVMGQFNDIIFFWPVGRWWDTPEKALSMTRGQEKLVLFPTCPFYFRQVNLPLQTTVSMICEYPRSLLPKYCFMLAVDASGSIPQRFCLTPSVGFCEYTTTDSSLLLMDGVCFQIFAIMSTASCAHMHLCKRPRRVNP